MSERPEVRELRCAPPGIGASTVRIGRGVAGELRDRTEGRETCWVVDATVGGALDVGNHTDLWIEFAGGESTKSFDCLERILRGMAEHGLTRKSCVVAIGGGSIGDLAGVAASLYLRGVTLIQVPTSLLSMIDSSVGGKTAINIPEGKNLIGTFWPAETVLIDPAFLSTLSDADYRSGLGEALKIAIGLDAELFRLLESHTSGALARDESILAQILEHCIATKIRVVEQDPREAGPRRLLNLGHTMGHAYEAWSSHRIPHGVAVAYGIETAIQHAETHDLMASADAARARRLLTAYGFGAADCPDAPPANLAPYLRRDKKVADGMLHWVLPTGIGESVVHPLPLP